VHCLEGGANYVIALVSMTTAADKVHISILCMPVYRCACVTYSQRLYVGQTCISACTIAAILLQVVIVPTDQFQTAALKEMHVVTCSGLAIHTHLANL